MRYTIFDHLLGQTLDPDRNWAENIYEDDQHIGWKVIMADTAGLTGERQAIGITEIAPGWEEEQDLVKVRFQDGKLRADIYQTNRPLEGAILGTGVGAVSGAGVGQPKATGFGALMGAILLGFGGWLAGRFTKVWRIRYHV